VSHVSVLFLFFYLVLIVMTLASRIFSCHNFISCVVITFLAMSHASLLLKCHINRLINYVSVYRTLADALADALDEQKDDCKESDCSSNVWC